MLEADRLRRTLDHALAPLRPAERTAVVYRYRLDGGGSRKVDDIAVELSLRRERVCQLQRRAEEHLARALRNTAA